MIGTRSNKIDRRDGFAHVVGPLAEAVSRVNHERGADDEHGVCVFECSNRGIDSMLWNTLPEKYNIGFQHPGAARARGYPKRVDAVRLDVGISVGGDHRASAKEIGIFRLDRSLN